MREFNTAGPCNPALHYTVMREALMAEGKENVRKGRYFTIFAPRQSGKTTYFQLLLATLKDEGFTPIWISFESLKTVTREEFYEALTHDLHLELSKQGIKIDYAIHNQLTLKYFFEELNHQAKSIVLVIDEFEGIPDVVLSEVMHTFRQIYHQKSDHALHSLMLVGVSTIAELIISSSSPFNIAAELPVPYFTFAELQDLIGQYISESGQQFEPAVIKAIYDNCAGQPGLACALCQHLVTKEVTDKSQAINMEAFYKTLQFFLTQKAHKNIMNIVQKAREKQGFILKLLFQSEPLPFNIYDPNISWLFAHGVVDNLNGQTDVIVPLYKKVLITAFRPLINGETSHYITSIHDTLSQYLTTDGLNINALLNEYRAYVKRRGFKAFDTENLKEAACHYSLDGFIHFFINQLGGQTYIEIPSGRGRVDILVRYRSQSYIIEIKIFSTLTLFNQGKGQLAEYLKSERLDEGYYVVFSHEHTEHDTLYTEEVIAGKQIYTHIVLTKFARPTDSLVPKSLRKRRK